MTAAFVFKMNGEGVGKLLRSETVEADLMRRARAVASAAGPGMKPSSVTGQTRARASVITTTFEAREAEAKRKQLTSAFGAARG